MRRRSLLYLDASAIIKLVLEEPESRALRRATSGATRLSSELALAEVPRAVARSSARRSPEERRRLIAVAEGMVVRLTLVELTRELLTDAGSVGPPRLRTHHAVHVASARSLGDELEAFVSYDRRQLDAASDAGLAVVSPGAPATR